MYCKKCGNRIDDDSVFCSKCGQKINEDNNNNDFFIRGGVLEKYLGKNSIDAVIATNTVIDDNLLDKYATEEQKDPVRIDYENIIKQNYELLEGDLLTTVDGTIKHDSLKLSSIIFSYLMR